MKTALVTGANRGIGLELCRLLKERGDHVIATCQSPSEELEALGVQVEKEINVTDDDSIRTLATSLAGTNIDLLINNAGILSDESIVDFDYESARKQFEVNTLGPLRVILGLKPCLSSGSKIGILTSRVGSLADNGSGGHYGYRMSKAAANMLGVNLSIDFKKEGIAVFLLHPGLVATRMVNFKGISPEEAATGLIARMDELGIEQTGSFWHANGEELPW